MEAIVIKSRFIKLAGFVTVLSITIPATLSVYATSDISYVESVSSIVNVDNPTFLSENSIEKNESDVVVTDIAEVLGMDTSEELQYSLIFGEELDKYEIKYTYSGIDILNSDYVAPEEVELIDIRIVANSNLRNGPSKDYERVGNVSKNDIVKTDGNIQNGFVHIISDDLGDCWIIERNISYDVEIPEETETPQATPATINFVDQSEALMNIDLPDESYTGAAVTLDPADRELLEHLVMGEAGNEGFIGAALVAQAIRDAIVYKGFTSVAEVRNALSYSGNIDNTPNADTLSAVSYIFDQGGCAVKHTVYYFYAFHKTESKWHESQQFITQVGNHRFFSTW